MNSLSKTYSKISEKVAKGTQARRLIELIAKKKTDQKSLKTFNQVNMILARRASFAGKSLSGIFSGISIISGVIDIKNATKTSDL
jgi:hypothetical protein